MMTMRSVFGEPPFMGYSYEQAEQFKVLVETNGGVLTDFGGQYVGWFEGDEKPECVKESGQLMVEKMITWSDKQVSRWSSSINMFLTGR